MIMRAISGVLIVNIYGLPEDQDNMRGLCGNFNGDRDDDFMAPDGTVMPCNMTTMDECLTYMRTWRVPPDQDMFKCNFRDNGPFDHRVPSMCTCETHAGEDVRCGPPFNPSTGERHCQL